MLWLLALLAAFSGTMMLLTDLHSIIAKRHFASDFGAGAGETAS